MRRPAPGSAKVGYVVGCGPPRVFGGGPEAVAKTIAGAVKSGRPKARYPVTISAHALIAQKRFTPDWAWDLMMRAQYPTPKP